jgi:hypothetical protein
MGFLADRVLDLHLRHASNTDAYMLNNLREQAAKWEICIALITGLQNNTQNMLAHIERQAKTDGIEELGPLQYQVTGPNNRPKVVLDNLG